MDRASLVKSRVERLIDDFPSWLDVFDRELPFARAGQRDGHVETLRRWEQLNGDVRAILSDEEFLLDLYKTLGAWGIGRRGSRLCSFERFQALLSAAEPRLSERQGVRLSDPVVAEPAFAGHLWDLVAGLGIVENSTPMVAGTKTLHHILPLLVVPIDRMYTGTFFAWSTSRMQYQQAELFIEAYGAFAQVARAVDLAAFTGSGWRMSQAKLVDNAIVAFCKEEGLMKASSNPIGSLHRSRVRGGKYGPLRDALALRSGTFDMSFAEIDLLVGGLPRSARIHREWWANHAGNPQGASWIAAGKEVDHPDLTRERVRFRSR